HVSLAKARTRADETCSPFVSLAKASPTFGESRASRRATSKLSFARRRRRVVRRKLAQSRDLNGPFALEFAKFAHKFISPFHLNQHITIALLWCRDDIARLQRQ